MQIIPLLAEHWEAVKAIYEEGIATGNATFQLEAPGWAEWDRGHLGHSRLVVLGSGSAGVVIGWAALSPVSGRRVYAGVAEVSVYVAAARRGEGVGIALLRTLITESERNGIWTLQAGIFPENMASVRIHLQCGFREVGRRERIGQMKGVWRDTVLMERRSGVVE